MNIRNKIVEDIYNTGWLEKHCRSVCFNGALAEDLMQEVALIILEYKPESALDIAYAKNQHLPLIRKIITNQFKSTTSPFWAKYRKHQHCEINEEITESYYDEDDMEGYWNE